jgi:phage tail tube protein FII
MSSSDKYTPIQILNLLDKLEKDIKRAGKTMDEIDFKKLPPHIDAAKLKKVDNDLYQAKDKILGLTVQADDKVKEEDKRLGYKRKTPKSSQPKKQ